MNVIEYLCVDQSFYEQVLTPWFRRAKRILCVIDFISQMHSHLSLSLMLSCPFWCSAGISDWPSWQHWTATLVTNCSDDASRNLPSARSNLSSVSIYSSIVPRSRFPTDSDLYPNTDQLWENMESPWFTLARVRQQFCQNIKTLFVKECMLWYGCYPSQEVQWCDVVFSFADHQKLDREARICRLLKHQNIG